MKLSLCNTMLSPLLSLSLSQPTLTQNSMASCVSGRATWASNFLHVLGFFINGWQGADAHF